MGGSEVGGVLILSSICGFIGFLGGLDAVAGWFNWGGGPTSLRSFSVSRYLVYLTLWLAI